MLGAIIGDMVGSGYEVFFQEKTVDFPAWTSESRFTDDSVLTVATAEALLTESDYAASYQKWGRLFPNAGFSRSFSRWIFVENPVPYNAYTNGPRCESAR